MRMCVRNYIWPTRIAWARSNGYKTKITDKITDGGGGGLDDA